MIRNAIILAKGVAGAKLIGIAIMPILTRLYAPEDFAVLAVFTSLVLILMPIMNLRFSLAIPLPKRELTASLLFVLGSVGSLFLFIVSELLFFLFRGSDLFSSLNSVNPYILFFVPIVALTLSLADMLSYFSLRKKDFNLISRATLVQSYSGNGSKLALFFLFESTGLLIGYIVGALSYLYTFCKSARVQFRKVIGFSTEIYKKIFVYYLNYVYLKIPAHFFYVLSAQSLILFSSAQYSDNEVGQLAIVFSIYSIPIAMISQSMSKVYYSEVSALTGRSYKNIMPLSVKSFKYNIVLGAIFSIALFVFSKFVFVPVFGAQWEFAGELASVYSLMSIFQFAAASLITALNVINRNLDSFCLHLLRLAIIVAILYVAYANSWSLYYLLVVFVIFMSLFYLSTCLFVFYRVGNLKTGSRDV